MLSVFDKETRESLIVRIDTLTENSTAQWGKMNVYQMIKHCILCEEMYLGKREYKRAVIGRVFGKIGLRNLLKDERPLKPNEPTSPAFKIAETNGDFAVEKRNWIALMEAYATYSNTRMVHWFFGKMTKEQVGQFVYKHTDHHLRQFNA
ncbi:MAG: hypothetical protein JWP88_154 [Flaviaesturariibacter sp.]|nr:hypothetical protein [Flaviaesturariibacter sp.]